MNRPPTVTTTNILSETARKISTAPVSQEWVGWEGRGCQGGIVAEKTEAVLGSLPHKQRLGLSPQLRVWAGCTSPAVTPAAPEMYPPHASRSSCSTCHFREKYDLGNLIWGVTDHTDLVSSGAAVVLTLHCQLYSPPSISAQLLHLFYMIRHFYSYSHNTY